jgi:hypothetical protein
MLAEPHLSQLPRQVSSIVSLKRLDYTNREGSV